MKILVDMNLSPSWVDKLNGGGFEATHWSRTGNPRAPDRDVLGWARSHGYVVFTHDPDFGAILAATGAAGPSVVQVRAQNVTPAHLAPIVLIALRQYRAQLEEGALMTIDEARNRVRILPVKKAARAGPKTSKPRPRKPKRKTTRRKPVMRHSCEG